MSIPAMVITLVLYYHYYSAIIDRMERPLEHKICPECEIFHVQQLHEHFGLEF